MPAAFQGTVFRASGDPILDLRPPPSLGEEQMRARLRLLETLNRRDSERNPANSELAARISSYELAYRMQRCAPQAVALENESPAVKKLYGLDNPVTGRFGRQCLMARRLVERGVRFVQLYHSDWDHHQDLSEPLTSVCKEVDQPTAALIRDLKQRGLLDRTLVIWGGEFGRTPMGEVREKGKIGRNHHIDAYTLMMAGGGLPPGHVVGGTDEFGFSPVGDHANVHDVQATLLHLLGLNHEKLTYRFMGRDFRLTDVAGRVIKPLVS